MNKSKVAIRISKIIRLIELLIGIGTVGFFSLMLIVELADETFDAKDVDNIVFIVFCLLIILIGIGFIALSRKRNKIIKKFKKYINILCDITDGYIPSIAATLGSSEEDVKSDLAFLIKKRYFVNAYIDQRLNCIVIANRKTNKDAEEIEETEQAVVDDPSVKSESDSEEKSAASPEVNAEVSTKEKDNSAVQEKEIPKELLTVKCRNCGGINTIVKGQIKECDFCGSAIKGE